MSNFYPVDTMPGTADCPGHCAVVKEPGTDIGSLGKLVGRPLRPSHMEENGLGRTEAPSGPVLWLPRVSAASQSACPLVPDTVGLCPPHTSGPWLAHLFGGERGPGWLGSGRGWTRRIEDCWSDGMRKQAQRALTLLYLA